MSPQIRDTFTVNERWNRWRCEAAQIDEPTSTLEFGEAEYAEIDRFCRSMGMIWFASCWDKESVAFIERFDPLCYKIASPSLTDDALPRRHARLGDRSSCRRE